MMAMKETLPWNLIMFLKYELLQTSIQFDRSFRYLYCILIEILKSLGNFMQVYTIRVNVEILLHAIVIIMMHSIQRILHR